MKPFPFDKVVSDFERLINHEINTHYSHIEMRVSSVSPTTLEGINQQVSNGFLTVWNGASDKTIYSSPEMNFKYRFWHDMKHYEFQLNTNADDEKKLNNKVCARILNPLVRELADIELAGQVDYYIKNGKFPADQLAFCLEQLKNRGYDVI